MERFKNPKELKNRKEKVVTERHNSHALIENFLRKKNKKTWIKTFAQKFAKKFPFNINHILSLCL